MSHPKRSVLLVELNEVTWDLMDPLLARCQMPVLARLLAEGCRGAPMSVERPPQMDPWITWTTVYTGRPQADHNVYFLQQPPDTIRAPRIWEICSRQGLSVGVFGSLCSWPPQRVDGFYVPDTFAPDTATHPVALAPIQQLNLTYTRSIRLPSDADGWIAKARLGPRLLRLGLRPGTVSAVAAQLARERVSSHARWRRVALQPRVNFDFFQRLYRRHRPRYASFHTNHVAHYMHTYWKAMQPELFAQPTSEQERKAYGGAIAHGYAAADRLLGDVLSLVGPDTVLVVASSMGQRPFVREKGKSIAQLRSLDRLLEILGVAGRARALSTMSDQFNVYADDAATLDAVESGLRAAYVETPDKPMFSTSRLGGAVTVNLATLEDGVDEGARCVFPHGGNGDTDHRYGDLVYGTGFVKSGYHDPKGSLVFYGAGVRRGARLADCDNLDIAPTLLTLLGLDVPAEMKGRVLSEAFA